MSITREAWYRIVDLRFEMIHQHLHRETVFLPYDIENKARRPIRWMNASCLKFLDKHIARYDFLSNRMNLYYSLARYNDFPTFSYNPNRKKQEQQLWKSEFYKHIRGYDFFIETDAEDISKAHEDTRKIKDLFEEYGLCYSLKASGSKGFHIIIDWLDFKHIPLPVFNLDIHSQLFDKIFYTHFPVNLDEPKGVDLVAMFKALAIRIKHVLAAPYIDTTVQDILRVVKTAYSWDVKSNNIAYPLTDEQFADFNPDLITPMNVLRQNNRKRGLLWRNTAELYVRQKNMTRFLKDMKIII